MDLKTVEQSKHKLIMKIEGEDHTFCNPLVKTLQQNKNVKIAAFNIDHPLERIPTLILETNTNTTAIKALQDAVKELKTLNKTFLKKFQSVSKKIK